MQCSPTKALAARVQPREKHIADEHDEQEQHNFTQIIAGAFLQSTATRNVIAC